MINIINKRSVQLKILKNFKKRNQSSSGSQISREINSTWVIVSKHLRILEEKKIVVNKVINGRTNGWTITLKGEKLLKEIIKLEKLLR